MLSYGQLACERSTQFKHAPWYTFKMLGLRVPAVNMVGLRRAVLLIVVCTLSQIRNKKQIIQILTAVPGYVVLSPALPSINLSIGVQQAVVQHVHGDRIEAVAGERDIYIEREMPAFLPACLPACLCIRTDAGLNVRLNQKGQGPHSSKVAPMDFLRWDASLSTSI